MAEFEDQTAAEVRGMARRRLWSLIILFAALAGIPFCCVVPCSIGMAYKQNETVYNTFIIAGMVLPLVCLATMILMILDRSRYTRAWNIAQFAVENGYAYVYHPKLGAYQFLDSMQLFSSASITSADNWVYGRYKKFAFTFVDYSYVIGHDRYAITNTQTVLVLHDAATGAPIFILYPRRWTDRLAKLFGGKSLELPGERKFNDAFVLSGFRKNEIADRFESDDLIDYCLDEPNLAMEVNNENLTLFRDRTLMQPNQYLEFLKYAVKMAALLRGES